MKLKGAHGKTITIGDTEWIDTRWNEQVDVFIVEGSIKMRNEGEIKLAVAAHRGHDGRYHPKNVLDGETHTWYQSKEGSLSEDWIIFKQRQPWRCYATRLMFRTVYSDCAIKTVVLWWSEDGKQYHKWTQIGGIKKTRREQWINLNEKEIAAAGGKLQYIKLKIVNNHGGSFNGLKGFAVSGFWGDRKL